MILLEAKIYPDDKRRFYCRLFVTQSRKDMVKAVKQMEYKPRGLPGKFLGICFGLARIDSIGRKMAHFSDIFVNLDDLGDDLEILSHECVHAAFNYTTRIGYSIPSPYMEEEIAMAQGRLYAEAKYHMIKAGLIRHPAYRMVA